MLTDFAGAPHTAILPIHFVTFIVPYSEGVQKRLLYYTCLSPRRLHNTYKISEKPESHIRDINCRIYYRRRQQAIEAFSSVCGLNKNVVC